jgi:pimeloyl-ACP methyl ester carboxylesterase
LAFHPNVDLRNSTADTSKEDAMSEIQAPTIAQGAAEGRRSRPYVGKQARERLLSAMPVTERRLELAGISTAVLEGGDGPPIVLLHGPGEYAAKWMRVIPDLAKTYRVVAPDLPGHGTSEVISGPLEADRVSVWLAELIERTCPTPPALVGQILGGAIAARFAIEQNDRLSHLVLVDAFGLVPFQPAPEFGVALSEYIAQPTEDTHDRLWRRCAFDLDGMRDRMGESWEWLRAYNLDRARATNLHAAQHSLMTQFGMAAIPPAELERITIPTTLIWGRHDLATQLADAEAASARYGWPLLVIENAADDPPIEQPKAFLRALREALETSTGRGTSHEHERHRHRWSRGRARQPDLEAARRIGGAPRGAAAAPRR